MKPDEKAKRQICVRKYVRNVTQVALTLVLSDGAYVGVAKTDLSIQTRIMKAVYCGNVVRKLFPSNHLALWEAFVHTV